MSNSSFNTSDLPESDTIATPEGDNEFAAGQPVRPLEDLETPPGSAPAAYDADQASGLGAVIEILDEVSRGKIQP
jgi:hypothetical protein